MGKNVHDEGTKQDERYDKIYDRYIWGEMDVDELRKSLSKFPSEYLKHRYNKRQAPKHKSCLSIFISQLKDVLQCTKEMIHAREKEFFSCITRILKLGKKDTSADTSHVTEVPVKNDGQNQEMIPVMYENNRSDLNGSEDEIKERQDKNKIQGSKALEKKNTSADTSHVTEVPIKYDGQNHEMKSLLDERTDPDGSEDEVKAVHDIERLIALNFAEIIEELQITTDLKRIGNFAEAIEKLQKTTDLKRIGVDYMLSKRSITDGLEDESKGEHKTKIKKYMSSNRLKIAEAIEKLQKTTDLKRIGVDSILSKRSITDGLEDEFKGEHNTKNKKYMSSNRLTNDEISNVLSELSALTKTNDEISNVLSELSALTKKIVEEIEELQITTDLKRIGKTAEEIKELQKNINLKLIRLFTDDGNSPIHFLATAIKKISVQRVEATNRIHTMKAMPGLYSHSPEIQRDTGNDFSDGMLQNQEFPKESLEMGHNDRIQTSVFSFCSSSESFTTSFFQLISLIPNDLLASTLDFLDERTYSQTDLIFIEVNRRGRRKYLLFTRFWMVTGDLFSNAIALTAHISDIYYTGIYPTDCRMNLYIPCLIGNYLYEKDEIDDRLPRQLMLNTQEPISGRSRYLTGYTNHRINL